MSFTVHYKISKTHLLCVNNIVVVSLIPHRYVLPVTLSCALTLWHVTWQPNSRPVNQIWCFGEMLEGSKAHIWHIKATRATCLKGAAFHTGSRKDFLKDFQVKPSFTVLKEDNEDNRCTLWRSTTRSPILVIHVRQRRPPNCHFCWVFCFSRGLHVDGGAGETLTVLFTCRATLPATKEDLHLLSEEAGGQGVKDGVQGTVDRQNKDHHPGVYRSCVDEHKAWC